MCEIKIHYTGMAETVDANIPYRFDSTDWKMKKKGIYGTFKKPKNPDFASAVKTLLQSRELSKDSPVIIMCTSGSRAPFAAKILIKDGFTKVYTQVEGFEGIRAKTGPRKGGWKNVGLPWSYDLCHGVMICCRKKCTIILILNTKRKLLRQSERFLMLTEPLKDLRHHPVNTPVSPATADL